MNFLVSIYLKIKEAYWYAVYYTVIKQERHSRTPRKCSQVFSNVRSVLSCNTGLRLLHLFYDKDLTCPKQHNALCLILWYNIGFWPIRVWAGSYLYYKWLQEPGHKCINVLSSKSLGIMCTKDVCGREPISTLKKFSRSTISWHYWDSINTLVDTRSTLSRHLAGWQSVECCLIFNWCIRVSRHITDFWPTVSFGFDNQDVGQVLIDCWPNRDVDRVSIKMSIKGIDWLLTKSSFTSTHNPTLV